MNAIRRHWPIENKLHWQPDVSFGEDDSIKVKENRTPNLSLLSKIVLSMIRSSSSGRYRGAKKVSGKMSGWNHEYLIGIILSYDFR
jgi:hypothetical protein